jgi:hypothetical protein
LIVTVVALVVFHDNVAACPWLTAVGDTLKEAVGNGGVTVTVAVAVVDPLAFEAVNV